ncbi:hypothetical protein ABTG41_11910, partial [Acinetobacter baumannii]
MGLPQVPPGKIAEEVSTSVSTIMQMPARFSGVGNFDMSGVHVRQVGNWTSGDFPLTSTMEHSKESDSVSLHKDGTGNLPKLRIHSPEMNGFLSRYGGKNIPTPASRIVGFEPNVLNNQWKDKQSGSFYSFSDIGSTDNGNEN